jgi:phage repressor protein C with HTH and peptisase S24 domain/DNA-binding XRE family transcriptional regulator
MEWYERLREIREKHGMSQAEFGRAIGKDATQVSRYERGVVKKFPNALYKLLMGIFPEEEIDYIEHGENSTNSRSIEGILDRLRKLSGTYNDREMCEILGIEYGTLDNWKAIDRIPDKRLKEIADKFGVSTEWIYTGKGNADIAHEELRAYGSDDDMNEIRVPLLDVKASAGEGNHVDSVDAFGVSRKISMDMSLFPGGADGVSAIQVDGYSMVPVLLPDSYVFFRDTKSWSGDGLYVLVFRGVLMVKQVEADPKSGNLWVKSANADYESWEYDPTEDQSTMRIVGRVIRVMM